MKSRSGVIVGTLLVFLVLPQGALGQDSSSTIANTMKHFYLTNSRNVSLALDRDALMLSANHDVQKLNIMATAYEVVFDGPKQIRVGMVGMRSRMKGSPSGGFWKWQGGFTFFDIVARGDEGEFDGGADDNLLCVNALGGVLIGYRDVIEVQANGAFNFVAVQAGEKLNEQQPDGGDNFFVEPEHASISLSFPSLSIYANFKYDLVTQSPRDAEIGFFRRWEDRSLGNVRLVAAYRHDYEVISPLDNGALNTAGPGSGFVSTVFKGDTSGIAEWRNYAPFASAKGTGDFIRLSAGLAMGEKLRYTFGEVQLGVPNKSLTSSDWFLFARVGRTLSRRDELYYNGIALGLDLPFVRGPETGKAYEGVYSAYARIWAGFQDYETIDRIGAVGALDSEELLDEDGNPSEPPMNLSNTLTIGGTVNLSW